MLKLKNQKYKPDDRMGNIEIHVSHGCNLTCDSCSHYSNHGHKGLLSIEEAQQWMKPWSHKLLPRWFSLMGGEPTMNRNLTRITEITAKIWKDTRVRIISNGFFLKNHPDLPATMADNNVQLRISLHDDSPQYKEKVKQIKDLVVDWQAKNPTLEVIWKEDWKVWLQVYKGFGNNMMPFEDDNPRKSWESCGVKYCRQLFLGQLWKCPNLAYLQLQDKKFDLHDKWTPYLTYRDGDLQGQAIGPDASIKEIKAFYEEEEISHCDMCPAKINYHKGLPDPLIPVSQLLKQSKARSND